MLGGMGRPEDWPILFLYSGWCWCYRRDLRWYIAGVWLVLLFAWFGVPGITNGRPFVAYQLAQDSPRAITGGKVGGTILRFTALNLWPVWVLALIALGWSLVVAVPRLARAGVGDLLPRRGRLLPRANEPLRAVLRSDQALVIGLAFCIVLWVLVEVAFALLGTPAVPRYMFEPAVGSVLLAGIGLGWLVRELPERLHVPWPVGTRRRRRAAGVPDPRPAPPRPDRAQGPHRAEGPHAPVQRAVGLHQGDRRLQGGPLLRRPGDRHRARLAARLADAHERRQRRPPAAEGAAPAPYADRAVHGAARRLGGVAVAHAAIEARLLPADEGRLDLSEQQHRRDADAQPPGRRFRIPPIPDTPTPG